jgi:hypothetical protein
MVLPSQITAGIWLYDAVSELPIPNTWVQVYQVNDMTTSFSQTSVSGRISQMVTAQLSGRWEFTVAGYQKGVIANVHRGQNSYSVSLWPFGYVPETGDPYVWPHEEVDIPITWDIPSPPPVVIPEPPPPVPEEWDDSYIPPTPPGALRISALSPEIIPNGIYHEGNPIEIAVSIFNDTPDLKEIRVKMRSAAGAVLDSEPDLYWKNLSPDESCSITLKFKSIIPKGFTNEHIGIELWDQHAGQSDRKYVTVGQPTTSPLEPSAAGYGGVLLLGALGLGAAYVLGEVAKK